MSRYFLLILSACALSALAPASPTALRAAGKAWSMPDHAAPAIPQSVQTEHHAIHDALMEATRTPGPVGAAARQLEAILAPHFQREEEIALPPLGLLAPLTAAERPAGMQAALAMSEALRKELPRMLEEHQKIRAAVEKLRGVAVEAHASGPAQLAEQLALHARSEEEVMYPAAILVGEVIRARMVRP
jgi:hypothetical protein